MSTMDYRLIRICDDAARGMPGEAVGRAQESLASALGVSEDLGGEEGARLADAAREAFVGGLSASLWAGAIVLALGAVGVLLLASKGGTTDPDTGKEGEKA